MIIFTVKLADEMERALARVFLQQFVGAQKQISQTPHCEFRRGNDPPKELLSPFGDTAVGDAKLLPLGYLAFTFFPSHLKTPERLQKAVDLMVNFLPYLDKHLKSTKSFMHSRMRARKNDLLRELKDAVGTTEATKYGSFVAKKGSQQKGRKILSSPRLAAI
jgi:actin related protein 2/3 complex subunit 2